MEEQKKKNRITRRDFMVTAGAATVFSIIPAHVMGGSNRPAPSDKLNIAGIGVGGMGGSNLKNLDDENIMVLFITVLLFLLICFISLETFRRYKCKLGFHAGHIEDGKLICHTCFKEVD